MPSLFGRVSSSSRKVAHNAATSNLIWALLTRNWPTVKRSVKQRLIIKEKSLLYHVFKGIFPKIF